MGTGKMVQHGVTKKQRCMWDTGRSMGGRRGGHAHGG